MPIADKVKLFNPGDRIVDSLLYSIEDGHDIHCVANWRLDAPRDSWFDVPQTLLIRNMRINVHFEETILRRFEDRGVVALDKNYVARDDNPDEAERSNVEASEEDVMKKAKTRWMAYCKQIAQKHIDQCQACRAVNMPPVPASGFTKRALEIAGFMDPADAYLKAAQGSVNEVAELKEQVRKLTELVTAQQDGKKGGAQATK